MRKVEDIDGSSRKARFPGGRGRRSGGTLSLMILGGYTATQGDTFRLFIGINPGFDPDSFTLATNLGSGLYWNTSALASTGVVTIVPETPAYACPFGGVSLLPQTQTA